MDRVLGTCLTRAYLIFIALRAVVEAAAKGY